MQWTQAAKTTLKRKSEVGGLPRADSKTYYRATAVHRARERCEDRQTGQRDRLASPELDHPAAVNGSSQGARQGHKYSTNGAGTSGCPHVK